MYQGHWVKVKVKRAKSMSVYPQLWVVCCCWSYDHITIVIIIDIVIIMEFEIFHRKWKYGRFAHAQCIRP